MKTGKYWLGSVVAYYATVLWAAGLGTGSVDQLQLNLFGNSTLQGQKAVYPQVIMTVTKKDARQPRSSSKIGPLSRNEIQAQVEEALRKSGIKITARYGDPTPDAPLSLGVTVSVVTAGEDSSPLYAAYVSTEVHQPVKLLANDKIRTLARTWPIVHHDGVTQRLLVLDLRTMEQKVKDEVARQVSLFINDYLAANPKDKQMITGTVRYLHLEGGFYGLVGDNGEKYDPVNLPEEYKKDGLRVKFQVREKKDMVGIHMWGKIVEIVKIERLQAETKDRL
jgi:hypothetical protein